MLVVFVTFLFCIIPSNESKIYTKIPNRNVELEICISDIIEKYFYRYNELTYIDTSDDQEVIKTINSIRVVSIISRTTKTIELAVPNESYLIRTRSVNNFSGTISNLTTEPSWNPLARYLILIKDIPREDLSFIFDILLKFHVIKVVVMNESNTDLYSYDSFDNYSCGVRYDRIIEYGKCSQANNKNLYPYKLVTGLKNCTLKIKSLHWPPYSINPTKSTPKRLLGLEQYIFKLLSYVEHFKTNFSYSDEDGETFTMIDKNLSAVGSLKFLQNGEADVVLGGTLLTHPRAQVFDYIHGHSVFVEDLCYQVKKATAVSPWKNHYLEFSAVVWLTLLFSFLVYFLFFIAVVRPKDIGRVFLNMLGYIFLFSSKIKGNCFTKYLFILWVWFAYLINSCYQSSLVSLVTNPYTDYQISNEMDLSKYSLKPCISTVMRQFMLSVGGSVFEDNQYKECNKLFESIRTVSGDSDKYTVTLHSLYTYNEHSFYDEKGIPMIYTFKRPLSKIIYAMYVYKGFPFLENLRIHTLRLQENGLIDNYLQYLYWKNNENYSFTENIRKSNISIPWYFLLCGYSLSVGLLIIEIFVKWITKR